MRSVLCIILTLLALECSIVYAHDAQRPSILQKRSTCGKRSITCTLTPEIEVGPFYYNTSLIRRNVTEDQAGVPATLQFTVIDVTTCEPLENAAVDIWAANAAGIYSAFTESDNEAPIGSTYLRGIQITNSSGNAEFDLIFPGYYSGRDTHIHIRVRLGGFQSSGSYGGGTIYHTGQVFFEDSVSDAIDAIYPYTENTHGTRTTLTEDHVYTGQEGVDSVATVTQVVAGTWAAGVILTVTVGVNTTAAAIAEETAGGTGSGMTGGSSGPFSSGDSGFDSTSPGTASTSQAVNTVATTASSSTHLSGSAVTLIVLAVLAFVGCIAGYTVMRKYGLAIKIVKQGTDHAPLAEAPMHMHEMEQQASPTAYVQLDPQEI